MCKNAAPNRLLTLTHSDKGWPDGETCWKASSKAFPELIRHIRKEHGQCEYLRVLELQANGMPHFHCLLRSNFLPHRAILTEWRRLCGAAGVNIKKIDDSFRTFHYLVKYLTKLHKIPWTDRHVSYSREFFRAEDLEQTEYAKLDEITKYTQHPWIWLRERYGWDKVRVIGEGKWELPDAPRQPETEIDPRSIGLPGPPEPSPQLPLSQRLVPGLVESDLSDESENLSPTGKRRRPSRRRQSPASNKSTGASVPF